MRWRLIVGAIVAGAFVIGSAAVYKRWIPIPNWPAHDTTGVDSQTVVSFVPPFSTREPETYTATRILTFSESWSGSDPSRRERTTRVLIAKDREKRREEFFDATSNAVVYLEIAAGRFLLLPASAVYADLKDTDNDFSGLSLANGSPELSADLLINEGWSGSKYQKLDAQKLEGRMTIRYRVTPVNTTTEQSETFLWVDESLGMPIRSETSFTDGVHTSRTLIELKDIKLSVDSKLFELPSNYQKVDMVRILDKVLAGRQPVSGDQK